MTSLSRAPEKPKTNFYSLILRMLFVIGFLAILTVQATPSFAQEGGRTHVVVPGENLSSIAAQYGVSLSALIRSNGITNANFIRVGQRLLIPASPGTVTKQPPTPVITPESTDFQPASRPATLTPSTAFIPQVQTTPPIAPRTSDTLYTVYPGESLSSIAARHNTTVAAIVARNRLPSSTIYAGQRLIIPAGVRRALATPTSRPRQPVLATKSVTNTTTPTGTTTRRTNPNPHDSPAVPATHANAYTRLPIATR